jgi:Mg/Co/Ni transporter MgtE
MINRWASSKLSGQVFKALHTGLTVNLISTPAAALKTCTQHETISELVERYPEDFDFIPVVDENQRLLGRLTHQLKELVEL